MSFKRIVAASACIALIAFPLEQAAAQAGAQVVPLSAEQARSLGVRFSPVAAASGLEVGTHARVVLKPDAQYVVAAPYGGMVPRVLVSVGQTVRAGQPLAGF